MCYCLGIWIFGLLFCSFLGKPLTGIFLDRTTGDAALYYEEMLEYSKRYLVYQSAFFGPLGVIFVYRNTLQGIGRSALTMVAGVTELVGRALSSFLLVGWFGFAGICLSNPIAWLAADFFLVPAYYVIMKKYRAPRAYGLKKLLLRVKPKKAA